MFWSLGHFTSPSIDTILDKEAGFTLEEEVPLGFAENYFLRFRR